MVLPEVCHQSRSATATATADCLLFDFDGTIIDSTPAIVRHWHRVGKEIGVDPEVILASSHGRRSIDVLKLYDPSRANWEYISGVEGQIPRLFVDDVIEVRGARQLLTSLDDQNLPWAVVTSATRALLQGWIDRLELATPKTFVVAEDVENGKPDPTCYLLGRGRLGLHDGARAIVFEDAPSGIRAGKAAGFQVVGLVTTHTAEQVREAGADWLVRDLSSVTARLGKDGQVVIEIGHCLS